MIVVSVHGWFLGWRKIIEPTMGYLNITEAEDIGTAIALFPPDVYFIKFAHTHAEVSFSTFLKIF